MVKKCWMTLEKTVWTQYLDDLGEDHDEYHVDGTIHASNTEEIPYVERPCKRCILMAGHTEGNLGCTCPWTNGIREPNLECRVYLYEKQLPIRVQHHRWDVFRSLYSIVV